MDTPTTATAPTALPPDRTTPAGNAISPGFLNHMERSARSCLAAAWLACQPDQPGDPHQNWTRHSAPEVIRAYEALAEIHVGRNPDRPRAPRTPDFSDRQSPAATAALKALAREVSDDPNWLQQIEELLPDHREGQPSRYFAWSALQRLPRNRRI